MTGKKNKLDKPDKQDKKEKSRKKRKSDINGRKEKTGKDNKSRKHANKEKDGKSSKQGKNNKSKKDKKSRKHVKKAKTVSDSEHTQKHNTVKEDVAKETGVTTSIATAKVAHHDDRAMRRAPEPSLTDMGKADTEPLQGTTTTSKRHLPVRLILAGSLSAVTVVWWGYQYWSTEPEVKNALPYKTGISPMVQQQSQPDTVTREQRSIRPPLPVPEKKKTRSPESAPTENTEQSHATNPAARNTYRPEQATKTENDPETATVPQQVSRPVVVQQQSSQRPQPYGQYQVYPGRGWPSWNGNYPPQPYYRQPGYLESE